MTTVGVLALQGSVAEHRKALMKLENVRAVEVKTPQDLEKVDGLILPGGESTTIGKLLRDFQMKAPIMERCKKGMPIWGTCAGMILMAKSIEGEKDSHLGMMDIHVRRNAYGSQLDSFKTKASIPQVSCSEIELVFIRAPWVERASESVEVLALVDNRIVAVKQNHLLATAFHPELTENAAFHQYFVEMINKNKKKEIFLEDHDE